MIAASGAPINPGFPPGARYCKGGLKALKFNSMLLRAITLALSVLLLHAPALAAGPKVVASVLPVWVFAKNVAGERAEVALLIKSGTDPHEFVLRPSDAMLIEKADLVLLNGAGLERNILRGIDPRKAFDTSEGVELIMLGQRPDPHVWLDPVSAQAQVQNIALALSGVDPEGKDYYSKNAVRYSERLQALHESLARGLAGLRARRLITYHESFNYFARRYGLLSYSLTGPDAEAPLPGRMREVYDIVRKESVPAVFEEAQFRPGLLKNLGEDLGARVCTLNSLVSGETSADLYERAMRENLETIVKCLGRK